MTKDYINPSFLIQHEFQIGDTVKNRYNYKGKIIAIFNDVYYDPCSKETSQTMQSAAVHYDEFKQSFVERLSSLTKVKEPKFKVGDKVKYTGTKKFQLTYEVMHVCQENDQKYYYILRHKGPAPLISNFQMINDILVYSNEAEEFEVVNQ